VINIRILALVKQAVEVNDREDIRVYIVIVSAI
jgi:hypothetical protein